ncbi:MAG: cupin domain-containing protein [Desulfobacterales bacterium]|nr:MAG: cupin domain-containing protein [Desulfobacterales bacterium]
MNQLYRSKNEAAAKVVVEDWGRLNWLAGRAVGNCEHLTLGRAMIKKGRSNPKHRHANCDEVLYLLQGKLEHIVGEQMLIMEAGDTCVVPAGVLHVARSIGEEDADIIVAYSAGDRQYQEEK